VFLNFAKKINDHEKNKKKVYLIIYYIFFVYQTLHIDTALITKWTPHFEN